MPSFQAFRCPNCGHTMKTLRNPVPTVDVIIEYEGGVVLILRKNPPPGWALPGGFVDYGETVDAAAHREAREETNLDLTDLKMFSVYSDPATGPQAAHHYHGICCTGPWAAQRGDDASKAQVFNLEHLPETRL